MKRSYTKSRVLLRQIKLQATRDRLGQSSVKKNIKNKYKGKKTNKKNINKKLGLGEGCGFGKDRTHDLIM